MMGRRGCDEFGEGWEKADPVCDECPDEYTCRDRTLRKARLVKKKTKVTSSSQVSANRGTYSYHTNMKYLLPAEGESAFHRILMNMVAGALSAIGGEIYAFFQEWRWPYITKVLELPEAKPEPMAEPAKENVKASPKPKSKPKTKVAKKIKVEDFEEDEFDFDLDDL